MFNKRGNVKVVIDGVSEHYGYYSNYNPDWIRKNLTNRGVEFPWPVEDTTVYFVGTIDTPISLSEKVRPGQTIKYAESMTAKAVRIDREAKEREELLRRAKEQAEFNRTKRRIKETKRFHS